MSIIDNLTKEIMTTLSDGSTPESDDEFQQSYEEVKETVTFLYVLIMAMKKYNVI